MGLVDAHPHRPAIAVGVGSHEVQGLQVDLAHRRAKEPLAEEDGIAVLGAPGIGFEGSRVRDALDALVGSLGSGDYFAINAYLARSQANDGHFRSIRRHVRASQRVATTLGYGPRFLHSTGQLHKGGPNTGVFLQVTAEAEEDVAIPDQNYSFGVLAAAQAEGDFAVLADRGRRALHLHLTGDVERGIAKLRDHIESQP